MSRRLLTCSALLLAAVCAAGRHPRAQTHEAEPAYVVRGRRTEAQQKTLTARVEQVHRALEATLTTHAPDLLAQLEPPASPKPGYQVLPTLLPDAAPPERTRPQVMSYYWGWSETRMARLATRLDALDAHVADALRGADEARHERLRAAVRDYQDVVRDRRGVDADVDYNWFWQRDIVSRRAWYDERTRLLERVDAAQRAGQPVPADVMAVMGRAYPGEFVRIESPSTTDTVVTVPMVTDVEDEAFLQAFVDHVERYWRARDGAHTYRTRIALERLTPRALYCGAAPTGSACEPPAPGSAVDLAAHLAHFPQGRAVLTTGAQTLHATGGRAIALGPHPVAPRTLAHEFGHILSFDDGYVRGYRDVGADGFRVMELVLDPADIMSAPGQGEVTPSHFERLAVGLEVQQQMAAGLNALYEQRNAVAAATAFERVLQLAPAHYGASLQLAKALDAAGREADARRQWERVASSAAAIGDHATLSSARNRLGPDR